MEIMNAPAGAVSVNNKPEAESANSEDYILTLISGKLCRVKLVDLLASSGGGISATARDLIITVLRNGVYSSDQSANITALEASLGDSGTSGGDSGGEAPTIGANGNWVIGGKDTGVSATGPAGADGKDGAPGTSVTVQTVTESAEDGGSNVVTFSDGKSVTIKNGKTGAKGDTGANASDAQVQAAAAAWLEAHPEATTTVEDGAVTNAKIADQAVTTDKMADEAVTMKKTNFFRILKYYNYSYPMPATASSNVQWLPIGNFSTFRSRGKYIVAKNVQSYFSLGNQVRYESTYLTAYSIASKTVDGVLYGIYTFDFDALLDEIVAAGGTEESSIRFNLGNSYARFASCEWCYQTDTEPTDEMIRAEFVGEEIDDTFKAAVNKAIVIADSDSAQPDYSSIAGKYGLHIGDSYTAGMSSLLESFDTSLGMTGALNYGIVSSTIRDRSSADNGYAKNPMVCRVCNIPSLDTSGNTIVGDYVPLDRTDIGLITFMGGTNDSYGYDSSVGDDPLDGSQTHIYGAMYMILEKLTAAYPGVPIIVILQPPRADITATDSPEGADISGLSQSLRSVLVSQRKQVVVRSVAQLFACKNVHIVDCCFDWYSPLNSDDLSAYWDSDLLHLTSNGYNEIINGTKFESLGSKLKEIYTP